MGDASPERPTCRIAFVLGEGDRLNSDAGDHLCALLELCGARGVAAVSFLVEEGFESVDDLSSLFQDIETKTENVLLKVMDEKSRAAPGKVEVALFGPGDGRQDLVEAVRRIAGSVISESDPGEEDARLAQALEAEMRFAQMSDPDLIVYFGGRKRLSNLGVWIGAYSEFAFLEEPWHSFDVSGLGTLLTNFGLRERRFGAIGG